MVNEAANQPSCDNSIKSNYVAKTVEVPVTTTSSSVQSLPNAINSFNNNVVKSEILNVNENKNLGPDIVAESSETPIVSAISDSPVIVPKMTVNIKQTQKNSDQTFQSLVLDTSKNLPPNKHFKQVRHVPQVDEVEKPSDNINIASVAIITLAPVTASATVVASTVPVPLQTTASIITPTPVPNVMPAPQPQRIREPRREERNKTEDKAKDADLKDEDNHAVSIKPNGPTPSIGKCQ